MISARVTANAIAAAAMGTAAILYRFSPQEYSFYPRCPFYAVTGHYCPGCGATRAVAELLHGHIGAAIHFNAAITMLLPFLLIYFGRMYWAALRENRLDWPTAPTFVWKAAMAIVLIFAIVRDLSPATF
jgi:hypothetical protein